MSINLLMHNHMIGFANLNRHRNSNLFEPLYEISNRFLANGYSVLYGAESLPTESTEEKIVKSIQNVNKSKKLQNNIPNGQLLLIDPDSIYKNSGTSYKSIVDFWNLNIEDIQRKLQRRTKGTIMISVPDSYFKRNMHDIFMMFEDKMGKTFPANVSMLCWYKENWLSNFSLASFITTLVNHQYSIHSGWKRKEWTSSKIIDLINKGIDKILGEGTATLLFQILKTTHKLHQNIVVSRPIVFEGRLRRLLGNDDYADSVIESIFKEIIKEISFSRTVTSSAE